MKRQEIADNWTLRLMRGNEFVSTEEKLPVHIPGTVYSTLLEAGRMPDPYVGDNELRVLPLMDNEFIFETAFELGEEMLSADALTLVFHGIDTLGEIFLNGIALGETDNMHRTWSFDISAVASRENTLRVNLHSPTAYIAAANRQNPVGGTSDAMDGFPQLRKAHCMFGWDWGQRLPDAGIFRKVEVIAHHNADISQVSFYQEHIKTGRGVHGYIIPEVRLHVTTQVSVYEEGEPVTLGSHEDLRRKGFAVEAELVSPDGAVYHMEGKRRGRITDEDGGTGVQQMIRVPDPRLWWPNGSGDQPLYTARVKLVEQATGDVIDVVEKRIGLRILTVNQDEMPDGGKNFAFKINGAPIFAMGANYVPQDNILPRVTRQRTEKLLREAVWANYNLIRVWGGGYYPDDDFYDLCDELGLIVWQDFMFACANYELTDAFEETVLAEITDNVRRIRHHACLGLWCGNNEVESQTIDGAWKPTLKQKADYIKIFEYRIPRLLSREDPDTCYWPSSPSSGGNFDAPQAENVGDVHYWEVWHAGKPFTEYRKHTFRFLSEFGFQSFPCLATIRTFAEDRDLNIFSRVMEMHQRNTAANGKLMQYLSETYLYPKNFEMVLYATQLMQADAIRYGVEHLRRNRGICMGSLVWQFNDISPVASWSGIDSLGNRKALHYAEKRMFAPIMISCREEGEITQMPFPNMQPRLVRCTFMLHVANETQDPVNASVRWSLRDAASAEVRSGSEEVQVLPYDGRWINGGEALDAMDIDQHEVHLEYVLEIAGREVSRGTTLFCAPKYYMFRDPHLSVSIEGEEAVVRSDAFAKGVCIMDGDRPAVLSDNFFDMEAGERRIRLECRPENKLRAISTYDIAG
ncbi:MAG: glycoside hydrolase family 2 protein [Lachnospiraceae bacterium]|nr:glycoside hydrolase family 2 protein [Lachnospiraceae bacterium]